MNVTSFIFSLLELMASPVFALALKPSHVLVLFNSETPESVLLAQHYQKARGIPNENMVGLPLAKAPDITLAEYQNTLLNPLREKYDGMAWWERRMDSTSTIGPVFNKKPVIAIMRGVPLRISRTNKNDESSVDSELSMLGIEHKELSLEGAKKNSYFQSTKSFLDENFPFLILTARIDASSNATCIRMINDAIEIEKTGLWGRCYVDVANKYPQGDGWLDAIATLNRKSGISTTIDRFSETFPANYPMNEASLYYGWYNQDVCGPFLNEAFRFRKGAVAMHLHSFSAEQISNPNKNWSAALLERGAAATIGNVYEPYLPMTHHMEIMHRNLLKGDTLIEAAWKSMPVLSWQGVVFGDPLYRPFQHFNGTGVIQKSDLEFRALRAASKQWGASSQKEITNLSKAAQRMKSGIIAEAIAGLYEQQSSFLEAKSWYEFAKNFYPANSDQMRQLLSIIALDRITQNKALAETNIKRAELLYPNAPELAAFQAWFTIMNPPPPAPKPPQK